MARLSPEMLTIILEGEKNQEQVQFLQVRKEVLPHLQSGKYPIRVDITWKYYANSSGMPLEEESERIACFEDALIPSLEKNNLALLTYTLTGEGERLWCFYTRNLKAFENTLNESTQDLPLFPLKIHAEEDPLQEAYLEASALL